MYAEQTICTAVTDDGTDLPVIDLTNPAFPCESEDDLAGMLDAHAAASQRVAQLPPEALDAVAATSALFRGLRAGTDTYVGALTTYLHRVGPAMLPSPYFGELDRQMASGLFAATLRVRQSHVVRLLTEALTAQLDAADATQPVRLLNLAGGCGCDSWNALLAVRRDRPELLEHRVVRILVLDIDPAGPSFGARAVAALREPGGPLEGLDVALEPTPFDWNEPDKLRGIELANAVAVGSSEGGLFEYGEPDVIRRNLSVLREVTPPGFVMVGGVMRNAESTDPRVRPATDTPLLPALKYYGIPVFREIAASAGWAIDNVIDSLTCHVVRMRAEGV